MMARLFIFVAFFLISPLVLAEGCALSGSPEKAVENYLKMMQAKRFGEAYAFVSESMTDGKSNKDWANLQQMFYEGGGVIIFGIDVRPHSSDGADTACVGSVVVPNVLKSRDNFNNQGIVEFELYTVVKQDGEWLVDTQETLFDQPDVDKWFPGEVIPEFLDKK